MQLVGIGHHAQVWASWRRVFVRTHTTLVTGNWKISARIVTRLWAGRLMFYYCQGQGFLSFCHMSRLALAPT